MSGEAPLSLRVRLAGLPPRDWGGWRAIEVGLQRGAGDVLPGEPDGADALRFDCEVRVGPAADPEAADGTVDLLGPFVHGKRGERFLYLSWSGERAGRREMFRRIKIHLRSIQREQADEARRSGRRLGVTVAGTGKDGGPACASVPLLDGGWLVAADPPG